MNQNDTPLFNAMKKYVTDQTVSFHVPAHKGGKGLKELREYIGDAALAIDVNGMEDLDNISNPKGVIKEAQMLAAEPFQADSSYFLVNGTTMGVQTMIMALTEPGDKIIVPRNAHKSAQNGMVLSGAIPVYVLPEVSKEMGFALNLTADSIIQTIEENPDAKGVMILNPTYYGVAPDLKRIASACLEKKIPLIVDEAHGGHFLFSEKLPPTGMEVGASMSSLSSHKSLGSLTQSSLLLTKGPLVKESQIKSVLSLIQTTSASYLLMASIDIARKQMALYGKEMVEKTISLAEYARKELNRIKGIHCFGPEDIADYPEFRFDPTKLTIHVRGLGLSGYEAERILRRDFRLQVELSNNDNVLALVTIGDNKETISHLIYAVKEMASRYEKTCQDTISIAIPDFLEVVLSPREAFYSKKISLPLREAIGKISTEMVMVYPPGIPLVCQGEILTKEVVEHIEWLKEQRCQLQGLSDPTGNTIRVVKE